MQYPKVIIHANRHMEKLIIGGIASMFVYGLLLPNDWRQQFGLFAQPIIWAADTLPSIAKLATFSSMPELIRGFYGLGAYVVPLFGFLMVVFCGALGARVRHAFSRPDWPFWKTFGFLYILLCPTLLFCLWMFYIHPFPPDNITESYTWGSRIFFRTLHSRFSLAFYGSIVTIGFGTFFYGLTILFVGPITLLFQGRKPEWRH